MIRAAPASGAAPQGRPGARRGASRKTSSSASLAVLYAPVIALLTADRGQQINRVAAMWLDITQARDAEERAKAGDFILPANHVPAKELTQRYKPIIAILMAPRDRQYKAVMRMQLQVRDARDMENMQAQGIGKQVPGRPAPLMSKGMSRMLAPQGGVSASLADPIDAGPGLAHAQTGPARDRAGGMT